MIFCRGGGGKTNNHEMSDAHKSDSMAIKNRSHKFCRRPKYAQEMSIAYKIKSGEKAKGTVPKAGLLYDFQ